MVSFVMSLLAIPARIFVGAVFFWAGYQKVFPLDTPNAPQVFSASIEAYKLGLPDALVTFTAFAVPWTEIIAGVALVLGLWTRASAAVIGAMLLLFMGLGIGALARGLEIKCGCFGDKTLLCTGGLGWCHIGENALMLGMAVLAMLARPVVAVDQVLGIRRAAPSA
jgi:uncharacterized membrane protein YphA (DoxX/SURF4 family)